MNMASIPTSAFRSFFGRAVGAVLAALLVLPVAHVAVAGEPVPGGPADRPAPAAVFTLEQALARAEERSPAMIGVASGLEVADARLRQARSWGNPTLTVDAENVLGRGAYASFDSAETTVAISQPIPLGGGRAGQVRAAQAGLARAAAHQALARRELRRDLTVAYAEAVAADRQAAISRDRGRIALETRDAVERRFAAGLESELQRARARVEASGLQAASRRAAAESLARRRALAAHWREETVGEPLDAGWFDAADAAGSRSPSPQEGPAAHPRLELARHRLDEARAVLDAARGARFGGLEATVGARRFSDAPSTDDRAWMLGLSVPLPLWDRNVEAIARARADLLTAELDAERDARSLAAEREAATAERAAARIEVEALVAEGLPSAENAARLARLGYEAGRLSLLERLDAERALSDLRERLERARLQLRRAEAVLESLL
jgi:cobalt-zinc-cadmium efflux system outer membrane protein